MPRQLPLVPVDSRPVGDAFPCVFTVAVEGDGVHVCGRPSSFLVVYRGSPRVPVPMCREHTLEVAEAGGYDVARAIEAPEG